MSANVKFDFQGLDHVALGCSDMKRTFDFYHGVLGMPVLHSIEYMGTAESGEQVPMGQHFFFGVGGDNPNAHIAFFYWKDGYQNVPDEKDGGPPSGVNPRAIKVGAMHHLNIRVAQDRIQEYCAKLAAEGVSYRHVTRYSDPEWREVRTTDGYTPPEPGCLMDSVYFDDPDGIHLELNAWLPAWDAWPNDHQPWSRDDR
ncbi:VOC family protein [Streptomyces solisilvae]|uniref:VOC family protein n=1 Tax=Streptomyces malaysiensis TaxID=92644 RepID=UPI0036A465A7